MRTHPLLKIPPPLFYVAAFLLGLVPEHLAPTPASFGDPQDNAVFFAGLASIATGFVFGPLNAVRFLFKKTTLNPKKQASSFFTGGLYRISRNPMYIGLFLIYVGVALVNHKLWPFATIVIPFAIIHRVVIPFEESQMAERFGKEYQDYCSRVGRWL